MTKENSSNKVTIIVAIITSVTSISVAIVTGFFGLRAVQMQKEAESTSSAIQVIATQGGETQAVLQDNALVLSNTPYPTYTALATYTPYPTSTFAIPNIPTSTTTPQTDLLFADNFDSKIDTTYWQILGKWMITDGRPIVVEKYKPVSFNSRTYSEFGIIIFPGTEQLDNIAIEFDVSDIVSVLLSYKNEANYKMFVVSTGGINELVFCTSGECIYIPESSKSISVKSPSHVRVEIRKNSLHVYVNEEQLYNYNDLPEDVTGTIGFLQGKGYQGIDNFRIYKLP